MNKLFFTILFSILLSGSAFAQKQDSLQKRQQIEHLKKRLLVTNEKAQRIVAIMDDYKTKAKALASSANLKEDEKRKQFERLISEKNSMLEKILDENQLKKIVPTGERKTVKN